MARSAYPVSYRLDVVLDELAPIESDARLDVHIGTARVPARLLRLGADYAQLRLAGPVVASRGDRVILRGESTLGGGTIVDPAPPRHRDEVRVALLERGDVAATVHAPVRADSLRFVADGDVAGVVRVGDWIFSRDWLDEYDAELRSRIAAADPIDPGVPLPAQPWASEVLRLLALERRGSKVYLPDAVPSLAGREDEAAALERELAATGMRATKVADDELARYLEARGRLVRLGDGYAIGADAFEVARDVLLTECRAAGGLTLARFRDLVGVGRRDAQLLLERLDADGVTRRVGERRVLRAAGTSTRSRSAPQ